MMRMDGKRWLKAPETMKKAPANQGSKVVFFWCYCAADVEIGEAGCWFENNPAPGSGRSK